MPRLSLACVLTCSVVVSSVAADDQSTAMTLVGDRLGAPALNVLDLHEALERLAALDDRKSQIVELKFFGGLTMNEIAQTLGVSRATVEREWAFSRAWLHREVSGTAAG